MRQIDSGLGKGWRAGGEFEIHGGMPGGPDLSLLSHDQKDALISALMAQVAALTARVVDLEAKLGLPPKTPDNSSLPPSKGQKASAASKPKAKANPHAGAYRPLHPNPTRERIVSALVCQDCGADVSDAPQSAVQVYDRIEIPEVQPDVTRVTLRGGVCPCCARRFKATAPEGLEPGSPFGPNLRAFVIYLRSVQGIPMARLTDVLKDLFGLDVSEGALVNILGAAREAFAAQTSLIKERLLSGTALASDETGLRVGKANWWLWVFHHGDSAAFVAEAHRSKAMVEKFLGAWRPDLWLSDRLGSQAGWARRDHQFCLAHLIRDVQYVADEGDGVFAPALKSLLKRACAIGRRRPDLADFDPEDLPRRPQPQAHAPPGAQTCPRGGAKTSANGQGDPGKPLRLHDQPGDRSHQQRLRARVTPRRSLSQNHKRLPERMGRQILRRPPLRHRDRAKALHPRPRRHSPHAPTRPAAAPAVTDRTGT